MDFIYQNKFFKYRRQELRKNATPQEVILWKYLRRSNLGYKFQRQYSIGPYIVDFYCSSKRLIIELDGNQHNEAEIKQYDVEKIKAFRNLNCTVLRFWNNDINKNLERVLEKIKHTLDTITPTRP